ncbi:aminotransferase class IV [Fontisphaera persica]|uniref:aminotransferase class IV n=1 Tax=Fontisphaera persica TaxID=2974023 RepID=UPI0024BF945B|nr:aminotransferase class IV [Fontisphaera persica]WCJ60033.1 aminotransferase class IV [Fontisphaera persica]
MPFVMLNGRLVHESQAMVSVFDRSFLYGDGLFETLLVWNSRPFRWEQHWERLQRGLELMRVALPFNAGQVKEQIIQLLAVNQARYAVMRLQVSRGVGARGYSPPDNSSPALVISTHPLEPVAPGQPREWRLHLSSIHLPPAHPLSHFKTCNKLWQVMARLEAKAHDAEEAVLLSAEGHLAEAAAGNLFWWTEGRLHTPPLTTGALPGITRQVILELARRWDWEVRETLAGPDVLAQAEGVFVTMSTLGVVEAVALNGHPLGRSPLTPQCHAGYWALVARESESRRCAPPNTIQVS